MAKPAHVQNQNPDLFIQNQRTILIAKQRQVRRTAVRLRQGGFDEPTLEDPTTIRFSAPPEDIEEALQKIDRGEYEICSDCGEEIPRKRLQANPAARYCAHCQEQQEKAARIQQMRDQGDGTGRQLSASEVGQDVDST